MTVAETKQNSQQEESSMAKQLEMYACGRSVILRPEDFNESAENLGLITALFGRRDGEGEYQRESVELVLEIGTVNPAHSPILK